MRGISIHVTAGLLFGIMAMRFFTVGVTGIIRAAAHCD